MVSFLSSDRLCQLDFPIFNVKFISNNFFVISGGGGSSKTGVPNKIIFFKITMKNEHAVCENVCEINTEAYLANSIEYVRGRNLLFVGFNDSFQIFRVHMNEDNDTGAVVETSSIGIFDICDVTASDNYSDGVIFNDDTTTRSVGDVSSCSIRELTNQTDSYISDMIVLPDKHVSSSVRVILALNYGLVVSAQINDGDNFEIHHYKSYKPIKRFKITPTHENIIHLTPDGIIYVWSYPGLQLLTNIDLNMANNNIDNKIRILCKCITKSRKHLLVGAFSKTASSFNKKPAASYICKFGLDNFLPVCNGVSTGIDRIVSMDTLEIGQNSYIACGTLCGSVVLIDGQTSKIISESKNIHSIGVTSLSFVSKEANTKTSPLGVISCSADSSCNYTQLAMGKPKKSWSFVFITLCFVGLITSLIIGTNVQTNFFA